MENEVISAEDQAKREAFLTEYQELCQKYGVGIRCQVQPAQFLAPLPEAPATATEALPDGAMVVDAEVVDTEATDATEA